MNQEDKDIAALCTTDICLLAFVNVECSTKNSRPAKEQVVVPDGLLAAAGRLSRLGLLDIDPSNKAICRANKMGFLAIDPVLVDALKEFCAK